MGVGAVPTQVPTEIYAVFVGGIDQDGSQRIVNALTTASLNAVQQVHLAFQSLGGGIGEGIFLYNLLRTLPFDLTVYNSGSVASIAVIAYLGAKRRVISPHASFMIHRTQTTTQAANTQTIKAFAESAVLFDHNIEAILREHIRMPDEKWKQFDNNDLWFSAKDAVNCGIAHEIGEFTPPPGAKVFTL
jgi:ATP-dependent Clp protease, protease subunit